MKLSKSCVQERSPEHWMYSFSISPHRKMSVLLETLIKSSNLGPNLPKFGNLITSIKKFDYFHSSFIKFLIVPMLIVLFGLGVGTLACRKCPQRVERSMEHVVRHKTQVNKIKNLKKKY
jgi:hypothetical protein